MGAVGAQVIVQKTLVIQTITLVIAPTACCAGVVGTTAPRLTYALRTASTTTARTRVISSVVVSPDRYDKIALRSYYD